MQASVLQAQVVYELVTNGANMFSATLPLSDPPSEQPSLSTAIDSGADKVTIRVCVGQHHVQVADNGCGMTFEELAKVSLTRCKPGSGALLSCCWVPSASCGDASAEFA